MTFAIYDTATMIVVGWMNPRGVTAEQLNAGLEEGRAALEVSERLFVPCRVENGELVALEIDYEAIEARQIRAQRNYLLSACDWTQTKDAPVDAAVWAAYRQALRDIPQQPGFPHNVEWPEVPA